MHAWLRADDPLTWTDDTAMTIGLARSLLASRRRVEPQHLGDTFAAAWRAEPWRGYGAGPPQIFAAAAGGTSYREAAAAMFDGTGSFGNGAAMRAAPVAVAGAPNLATVAELAREQALVTHAHPLGQDGAVLLAVAVAITAASADGPADGLRPALSAARDHLETAAMGEAFEVALDVAREPAVEDVARAVGNGIAAVEAVPAAIAAFLWDPDDPVAVLVRAVTLGGDTDTIAAMATAIAGSRTGAAALPALLLARLEDRDLLVELADRLAAPSGGSGGLEPSPLVHKLSWGSVATEVGTFRDAKLWPGGGRDWDWNETGTAHRPGIQPSDVAELVDHGAATVILSRGQRQRLEVMDATLATLEERGVTVEVLESSAAVDRYNELARAGNAVGALVHSTC